MTPYEMMEEEIHQIPKFGATASLKNLSAYLDILGHPEHGLPVIHVAGTNGKGSTCAFVESVLRAAGYKTALFTSPHLVTMAERFRINFLPCKEEQLVWAWEQVKGLMEEHANKLAPLTYFEILFLMSLLIFKEEKPDYCIMEVGLGGRYDATVLTEPIVSVIASISLDHTAILGDTIEQIAYEKAGIIKPGVPVVALDEGNGAFEVIEAVSRENMSKIFRVSLEDITICKKNHNVIDFLLQSSYYKNTKLTIHSFADYQTMNAALAYSVLRTILPDLSEEIIQEGLFTMSWDGRMEAITPQIFVDGAHNPGAIHQMVTMLSGQTEGWKLLFAVCADKDFTSMIEELCQIPWEKIYITRMQGTRGASVEQVEACFRSFTACPIQSDPAVDQAFLRASTELEKTDRLLCLGSLYLVGELKRLIKTA